MTFSWQTPWAKAREAREANAAQLQLRVLNAIQDIHQDQAVATAEAAARATLDREAYLAAITALRDLGESQSQAFAQIAKAIEAYMSLWQLNANAQVQGRVLTDYDEWAEEQKKLKQAGFPVEAPPADQMAWVLRESAREGSLS